MKKAILLALVLALPGAALAAGGHGAKLDAVNIDLNDRESLQRGARLFVNYCLSCHSASYMRYNRMGADLGIPEDKLVENMLFIPDAKGDLKPGSLMKSNLSEEVAKAAFNSMPPDLSLIARSRGPEWFYTYMRSFYLDAKAPSGWNNVVFPGVSMPHVLGDLQGQQRAVYKTVKHESETVKDGKKVKETREEKVFDRFELERAGSMTPEQYDSAMRDLTGFMVYLGEPAKLERYRLGVLVLVFLFIFLAVAWLLNREYWKDVH
jgi:ubiquinol-cytochrome c reductase cytochrome c1 subunit